MSAEIRIICDWCHNVHPTLGWCWKGQSTVAKLRKQLKEKAGWKVRLKNGQDFCPQCAAEKRDTE